MEYIKSHNYDVDAKSLLWFLVNFFPQEKGVHNWLGYYRYTFWRFKLEEVKANKIPMIEWYRSHEEKYNHTYFEDYDRNEFKEKSGWFDKPVFRKRKRCFFGSYDVFNQF
jgi:hypothetical protein